MPRQRAVRARLDLLAGSVGALRLILVLSVLSQATKVAKVELPAKDGLSLSHVCCANVSLSFGRIVSIRRPLAPRKNRLTLGRTPIRHIALRTKR
jgi:hypothetical protein